MKKVRKFYTPKEVDDMLLAALSAAMREWDLNPDDIKTYKTFDAMKDALKGAVAAEAREIEELKALEASIPAWMKQLEALKLNPAAFTKDDLAAAVNGIIDVMLTQMATNTQVIELGDAVIEPGPEAENRLLTIWKNRIMPKLANLDEPWFQGKTTVTEKKS